MSSLRDRLASAEASCRELEAENEQLQRECDELGREVDKWKLLAEQALRGEVEDE